jgi:hypothetical protein
VLHHQSGEPIRRDLRYIAQLGSEANEHVGHPGDQLGLTAGPFQIAIDAIYELGLH